MSDMPILRRSRTDDIHVESFLENLHRIAAVATSPIRRVVDLTRSEDTEASVQDRTLDVSDARAER